MARITHGHATNGKSLTYNTWINMLNRCRQKNGTSYHRYGGRGIVVCDRWKTFANFLADMGEKPEGLTLDRINNNGNYEPSNCRWATIKEQARNREYVFLTHPNTGEKLAIAEWEKRLDLNHGHIWLRLKKGWSLEKALSTPNLHSHYNWRSKT